MQTPLFEIKGFGGGMTLSDTIGREDQFKIGKNLDYEAKPGKLTNGLGWAANYESSNTALTANIVSILHASNGEVYLGGSDTRIYQLNNTTPYADIDVVHDVTAAGAIESLAEYGAYVYWGQGSRIGRTNLTGGIGWNDNWQTSLDGKYIPLKSSTDNKLYIGNGHNIASWDGTTYDSAALDLSLTYEAQRLEDFGYRYLAIGANAVYTGFVNASKCKIFLWDRSDPDWNDEISIPEKSIQAMKFVGGYLWIWAGASCNIYVIPEDSRKATKMFEFTLEDKATELVVHPNSVTERDGRIYFGLSDTEVQSSFAEKLHPRNPTGIYSFPSDPNNFKLNLEYNYTGNIEKYYALEKVTLGSGINFLMTGLEYALNASATVYSLKRQLVQSSEYLYKDEGTYESFVYKPSADKQMFTESFGVEFEPFPANCSLSMYYKKEGDTTWNKVFENFETANATEKIVLKKVKAKQLQIKLKIKADTPSFKYTRPYVEKIWVAGHLIPRLPQ